MVTTVGRKMPRVQSVVIPLLRDALPGGVDVGSWFSDVSRRQMPFLNVRRLGGLPEQSRPDLLDFAVIELTAYADARDDNYQGLTGCEDLYLDAKYVLFKAVRNQIVVNDIGYLHSYFETLGPTQLDSPFEDSWRVQGLIQLGLRPVRN